MCHECVDVATSTELSVSHLGNHYYVQLQFLYPFGFFNLSTANYTYNVRPSGYGLSLPSVKKVLFKNSFIMRGLFKYK